MKTEFGLSELWNKDLTDTRGRNGTIVLGFQNLGTQENKTSVFLKNSTDKEFLPNLTRAAKGSMPNHISLSG